MATAEAWQPAPSLPPPRTETGWIGWARANLFGNWLSGLVTVVSVPLILWAVWRMVGWIIGTADWTLVASRPQQYLMGLYPTEFAWRPLVGWLLVSILFGMAAAMWGGAARRIAIGYSAVTVLLGVLPYGLFHEGVVMPWWVRAFILGNLLTLGIGYLLGMNPKTASPRNFVLGGIAIYVALLLVLIGIPGVPGMEEVAPRKWGGLMLNLILAVSGIFFAFPIGVLLALGRRSNLPVVKVICVMFIEVFRGVPLITLLFMSQVLVPLALPANFPVDSVTRAAIVITLFSAAYTAENIRGGLQGLHPGQAEAARALGLPGWQVTTLIQLPQAIRNVIPAIVGQFISLFKDTSLVYIVGMLDILEMGRSIVQGNVQFADNGRELMLFVAAVFWVFTYTMSYVSRRVERHLGVGRR
jgi:general L-amino acid transport system permease protein